MKSDKILEALEGFSRVLDSGEPLEKHFRVTKVEKVNAMEYVVTEKPDPALLHLYAGPSYHQEGYVVGNRAGLTRLRDAINKALDGPDNITVTDDCVYVTDGEGYDVIIICQNTPWREAPWSKMAVPYTDEDGKIQVQPGDKWPHELLTKKDIKRLYP